jgi:hypothetical protein
LRLDATPRVPHRLTAFVGYPLDADPSFEVVLTFDGRRVFQGNAATLAGRRLAWATGKAVKLIVVDGLVPQGSEARLGFEVRAGAPSPVPVSLEFVQFYRVD